MFEPRYRKCKSCENTLAWTTALGEKHELFKTKEWRYWNGRINACGHDSFKLWKSLSILMKFDKGTFICSEISGSDFLTFFENKVTNFRRGTGHSAPVDVLPPAAMNFQALHTYTSEEVRRRVLDSPLKSCALDPIPTFLLREMIKHTTTIHHANVQRFSIGGMFAIVSASHHHHTDP